MSDTVFYPLAFLLGAAANALLTLSALIGRKSAAARFIADFTAGIIGFSPLPALVLLFRDGIFTAYTFLFFTTGFASANAVIVGIKNRRCHRAKQTPSR